MNTGTNDKKEATDNEREALSRYFQKQRQQQLGTFPIVPTAVEAEHGGTRYVIVYSIAGMHAAYVIAKHGEVHQLHTWPQEIDPFQRPSF